MKFLVSQVLRLIKPYKKKEFCGIILTLFYAVSVYLVPLASQYLIDDVIPTNSKSKLLYGIILFTIICFLQPIIGYFKDKLFVKITESITKDVRDGLFSNIVCSDFDFISSAKGGDLISIIMNDGRGASNFISTIFANLLKNILMIIMIFLGMFFISWEITISVMILFGLYYLVNLLYGKRIQRVSQNIQENYDELCSCVNQTNNAILSIKAFNQERSAIKRFETISSKMKRDNTQIDTMSLLINNMSMIAISLCLAIIYGWGALKVMSGILTIGEVIAMGLYFQLLNQPFFELMNLGINTNIIVPIFKRIEKYNQLKLEEKGTYEGKLSFSDITIKNLSYTYQVDGNKALYDVSLQIPDKGLVSIIGESGSGKSTFTKILLKLLSVEDGKIFFGDKDINKISIQTLRANISYVPQESEVLNDTIYNNIRFGMSGIKDEEIEDICKRMRLHDRISTLDGEYNSILTEKVNLSGGEKQRILIARGIVKKSPILILDEPLSALDTENIDIIVGILNELAKNRLIIMISHYECEEINADVIIKFDAGKATVL